MTATPPAGAVDAAGRLTGNLACRRCGYNLRGLDASASCPECAAPVERSLPGEPLEFSDPAWLARVARGITWLAVGVAASLTWRIMLWSIMWIDAGLVRPGLWMAVWVPVSLIELAGAWMLTAPEPTRPGGARLTLRRLARGLTIAGCADVLATMGHAMTWGSAVAVFGGRPGSGVVDVVDELLGAMAAAGTVAVLAYLRRLLARAARRNLARQAAVVVWGCALLLGLRVAGWLVPVLWNVLSSAAKFASLTPPKADIRAWVLESLHWGEWAGTLAFGAWACVLLAAARGALRSLAAGAARATGSPLPGARRRT